MLSSFIHENGKIRVQWLAHGQESASPGSNLTPNSVLVQWSFCYKKLNIQESSEGKPRWWWKKIPIQEPDTRHRVQPVQSGAKWSRKEKRWLLPTRYWPPLILLVKQTIEHSGELGMNFICSCLGHQLLVPSLVEDMHFFPQLCFTELLP